MTADKLVDLPMPALWNREPGEVSVPLYTADQLRAYGEACALAQSAASGESLAQAIEHGAKGWERAEQVQAQASDLIGSLVSLVKGMYLIAADLEGMRFNGRPIAEVIGDLLAADSAAEMRAALDPPLAAGRDGVGGG